MANFYGKYTGIFGGGGGGSPTFVQGSPTGVVDGANVTFTLPSSPSTNANLLLWLDGGVQYQGIGLDYTVSGGTITMGTAPVVNQTLWYFYS